MNADRLHDLLDCDKALLLALHTTAAGPAGRLPFTEKFLRTAPSGHVFGMTQGAGMGWDPARLSAAQFLILSTQGGIRAPDGRPVALGYHTGHWEVGLLMEEAARTIAASGAVPFAAFVSDPCDGRSNGTPAMFDSLPYRNDAAIVFRRLIRSLPLCRGVLGVATCDKGLPAMMMALAGTKRLPCVLVPGGTTLRTADGEDTAKVQTLGARFAHGEISLEYAATAGCRACGSAGGGCQFMGTAATSQVVGEALGMSLPHSALCPSGADLWRDLARRSARALLAMDHAATSLSEILSEDSVHNAMVVHAAFGGSTNLVLHLPAIAHAAGLPRPGVDDWSRINASVPRLVDVLPNGPRHFATVQVYFAGGVPEVMLHLRALGLLRLGARTVTGATLGENLEWWERSERRSALRARLLELDGVDADSVILEPGAARNAGLASTVSFLSGNLAPEGALVKSTAIDPVLLDSAGVFLHEGPVRVFCTEERAIAAVKSRGDDALRKGEIVVLCGIGPSIGMPETYQITSAFRYLPRMKGVVLLTDGRFSGVSTGPCIGHISPEALAGGPIGRLRDGDRVRIRIDTRRLEGSVDLLAAADGAVAEKILEARDPHPDLSVRDDVPEDTQLWAALQAVSGGSWGGCVYDVRSIRKKLLAGGEGEKAASLKPPLQRQV